MKLAVLIAGEYREFKIAHKFWSFLKWPNVDCYFATWDKSIKVDKDRTINPTVEYIKKEDITDYISIVDYDIANIDNAPYTHSSGYMIDRWKKVILLMEKSGIQYDRVILIRPDLALEFDETFLQNFLSTTPDDNSALYSFTFMSIYNAQDISKYKPLGDLIYFANSQAILGFLNLPMQTLLDAYGKQHTVLPSFPPALPDIHQYLGQHLSKFYKKLYNLPINKFCVVRSNCRELINPTFGECKLKAKIWWETYHKVFYDMTDNFWEKNNNKPIVRQLNANSINLWKNYDTNTWIESNTATKWQSPDNEENYIKNFITNKGIPNHTNKTFCTGDKFISYGLDDITYVYNSYGFRVSNVGPKEYEHSYDYPVFVVAGCSVTEGIGLPEEHIWHSQLLRRFITNETKKPIAKFNLGKGGRSIDSCIRFLYISIQHKGLKPDLVYLLLPPIARTDFILNNKNDWFVYNFIPGAVNLNENCLDSYKIAVNMNDRQRYHNAFKNLLLLKWFLESKNIPWFFSSWMNEFSPISIAHGSNNTESEIPSELKPHYIQTNMLYDRSLKETPFTQNVARDCAHYGPNSHYDVCSQMFQGLINKPGFNKFLHRIKS